MTKTQEINKIDGLIKDALVSLNNIRTLIDQIDKEVALLSPNRIILEQNIEFLKKQETIPLAHEYRKIKQELSNTKKRLEFIITDRDNKNKACSDIENIIEQYKKKRAILIISGANNILRVNFGGRNGKR